MTEELFGLLGVTFALICVNGFFVAAEFSLISAPRARLDQLAQEGSRAARAIVRILGNVADQERYVATSQLGLSVASLGLGMVAERGLVGLLSRTLGSMAYAHSVGIVLVLGFLTFWHIVLGEMVPKSIGLVRAEKTVLLLIHPMQLLGRLMSPVVWLLSGIGQAVLRLCRLPVSTDISLVYSPEELRLIVEESHRKGMLEGEEHDLMQNVITFGERAVRQVMVGRTRITGLPLDSTVDQALKTVASDAYTRYPVYKRDMDHIVGMVHVKDLVRSRQRNPGVSPIKPLLREIPFVPHSMLTDELFEKMRDDRVQMAVVLDEHGGTAGIVTMEDLIEEIFGEVRDEFDVEEVEPLAKLGDGSVRVQGDVLLSDVAETFDRDDLKWEDVENVNALVTDRLGRPPRVGDAVEDQALRLVVESVRERTVGTARIYNLAPPTSLDEHGA